MKRAWAVLLAAVLGACSGDVERPGPTGPAGPKLDTRVVRVLSPRPGEVLSVDAVVREPGLVVVADVSRLAGGGGVRFSGGPRLEARVGGVVGPRRGEGLSVDAGVREPGRGVVAEVSRLAGGGAVRFSVATDLGSTPFFERDVIREPGRLTANTRVPVDVSV